MAPGTDWTRRTFVRTLSSISALGGMALVAPWSSASRFQSARRPMSPRFAYIASSNDLIHVFSIDGNGIWSPIQTLSSVCPSCLTLSPDQCFLYVANAVDSFEYLPTGSVEAYSIDAYSGRLTQLNRQALALSATAPKCVSVSPDGRHLAVAAAGGAAYNLLPLRRDGSVARVTSSLKQMGSGPREKQQARALPQAVLFHHGGALLATDLGSDRISAFGVRDGAMSLEHAHAAVPGSGPSHIVAHPSGWLFFVAGALDPVVSSFRYEAATEVPIQGMQHFDYPGEGITGLAIHASGSLLFVADKTGISVGETDANGAINFVTRQTRGANAPVALAASADGAHLFALNSGNGSVLRYEVDLRGARLSEPVELATVILPVGVALKH